MQKKILLLMISGLFCALQFASTNSAFGHDAASGLPTGKRQHKPVNLIRPAKSLRRSKKRHGRSVKPSSQNQRYILY